MTRNADDYDGSGRAASWSRVGLFRDLHASGFIMTEAWGCGPGGAVGRGFPGDAPSAAVWWPADGSAALNLNPGPGFASVATYANERYQFGLVDDGTRTYPARWSGSRETYFNLTPPFYQGGQVNGGDGDVQVGRWDGATSPPTPTPAPACGATRARAS